jgi:hypothetical protein
MRRASDGKIEIISLRFRFDYYVFYFALKFAVTVLTQFFHRTYAKLSQLGVADDDSA